MCSRSPDFQSTKLEPILWTIPRRSFRKLRLAPVKLGRLSLFQKENPLVMFIPLTPNDVPTLTATFPYISASESDRYPNGDFHQGVNWGASLDVV